MRFKGASDVVSAAFVALLYPRSPQSFLGEFVMKTERTALALFAGTLRKKRKSKPGKDRGEARAPVPTKLPYRVGTLFKCRPSCSQADKKKKRLCSDYFVVLQISLRIRIAFD